MYDFVCIYVYVSYVIFYPPAAVILASKGSKQCEKIHCLKSQLKIEYIYYRIPVVERPLKISVY